MKFNSRMNLKLKLQPIVEGQGEVAALPVLLRRFIEETNAWGIEVGRPIKWHRSQLVQQSGLEKAVKVALREPNCGAVLIMFDGDDDCPAMLGPMVHQWAMAVSGNVPCEVVIPHREYEAWFLASIKSLRVSPHIKNDADLHPNPEAPRGAKEQLKPRMRGDRSYVPTQHQPAFSAAFSMAEAYAGCRSFRKLTSAFGALLRANGYDIDPWPPTGWVGGPG